MASHDNSRLFKPLKVGNLTLSHRTVLAPLTRFRASDSHVPLPFVKTYYSQRGSEPGTLLITEGTVPTPSTGLYPKVPGIWTSEQIDGWKEVTSAVHAKGSYIFTQLWPIGRAADAEATKTGSGGSAVVVSSSATPLSNNPPPKELSIPEIKSIVAEIAQAARNAVSAGFDGIEIHGANGYLVDQFIQDVVNHRTDEYGGSIENRSRFALEVVDAVVQAIGPERVGIRLSPFSEFNEMKMADPYPQFTHLIRELRKRNLAYLHLVESRVNGNADTVGVEKIDPLVDAWYQADASTQAAPGPVFLAGGFKSESAFQAVDQTFPDKDIAIVFGRYWISTPDLPFRLRHGVDLNPYNRDTFYLPGVETGYTDYPFSDEFLKSHQGERDVKAKA